MNILIVVTDAEGKRLNYQTEYLLDGRKQIFYEPAVIGMLISLYQLITMGLNQGGKSDTPGLQCTGSTHGQYRRISCKVFSDFNASESQCFGTAIGVQPA